MKGKEIYNFYLSQIQDDFLPYWDKFYDYEDGGILNCINNFGDRKLSDNKFTWSQGRYLWILGKIYELNKDNIFEKVNNEELLRKMEGTYKFIIDYCIYDESKCCYLLDKQGNKLIDKRTGRYDASIFADCFALIGMSQYVKVLNKYDEAQKVMDLYKSIVKRIESKDFLTEPYPIPEGYRNHSIPMILINSTYEYIKMLETLGIDVKKEIEKTQSYVDDILNNFYDNGLIREFISTEENYKNRLLDRHINPGHTLEDMWFIIEFLMDYGDLDKYIDKIILTSKKTFNIGWDTKYGGLLRFVDKDGGIPKGNPGDSDFEKLIVDTHDMKLWWPHSEILYVFLLLFEITEDIEFLDLYNKSAQYVFDTFPNKEIGEWIQIRKRDGSPEEKLVALPVKDPFHIIRNFLKIIELYRGA